MIVLRKFGDTQFIMKNAFNLFNSCKTSNIEYGKCAVANCYVNGIGVAQNAKLAFNIYEKYLQQSIPIILVEAAKLYFEGKVTKKNYKKYMLCLKNGFRFGSR